MKNGFIAAEIPGRHNRGALKGAVYGQAENTEAKAAESRIENIDFSGLNQKLKDQLCIDPRIKLSAVREQRKTGITLVIPALKSISEQTIESLPPEKSRIAGSFDRSRAIPGDSLFIVSFYFPASSKTNAGSNTNTSAVTRNSAAHKTSKNNMI